MMGNCLRCVFSLATVGVASGPGLSGRVVDEGKMI